jgi:hypothetical protein
LVGGRKLLFLRYSHYFYTPTRNILENEGGFSCFSGMGTEQGEEKQTDDASEKKKRWGEKNETIKKQ